jgi:hypothetical protein
MKFRKSPQMVKSCIAALTVGVMALATSSNAEKLVGLSFPSQGAGDNDILTFDSAAPGVIQQSHPISGLGASETLRGIDFWNGTIFGLGSSGNLYRVDNNTGVASLIGSLGLVLNGASFGFENSSNGVHIVSELGQNILASRATGAGVANPAVNPVGTFLSALAFQRSSGTMFGIDSQANSFGTFNAGTGLYSTVGLVGFDVARNNGFDISEATGIAYLVSGASSSDLQANLYRVNLATGLATLVGLVGNVGDNTLLRGLTVIPEPGTATLLIGGVLGLIAMRARRRE